MAHMWRREPARGGGPGSGVWSLIPVTLALIVANAAVFALQIPFRLAAGPTALDLVTEWLGLWPAEALRSGCVWQFVTYGFVHSVDILHIVFNMLLLFWFGRDVELLFGRRKYFSFYFGAIIFGGLCFALTYAFSPKNVVAVGASGAVMAVLVAAAIHWPNRILLLFLLIPVKLVYAVLIFVLMDLYWLFFSISPNIAVSAHLGGAAWGAAFVYASRWFGGVGESLQLRRQASAAERRAEENARLDEILAKVHEHGMHTLSTSEKRFLKRFSERRRRQ